MRTPAGRNKPKIADLQAHNVDKVFLEWFGVYRIKGS